jgi:hypothetical protein
VLIDTNIELLQHDLDYLTKASNRRLKAIGEDNSRAICEYIKCFES